VASRTGVAVAVERERSVVDPAGADAERGAVPRVRSAAAPGAVAAHRASARRGRARRERLAVPDARAGVRLAGGWLLHRLGPLPAAHQTRRGAARRLDRVDAARPDV